MTKAKAKTASKSGSLPAKMQTATIVSGEGTDAEIRQRCAENVAGWDDLSERSKADMVRLMRGFWQREVAPTYEVRKVEGGSCFIRVPDDNNTTLSVLRTVEAFASPSQAYVDDRLANLANCSLSSGSVSSDKLSAAVAFVHGGQPQDTVQSSLLVQMAATHDAALKALGRVGTSELIPQAQLWGNLSAKLLNAFTRQAETLAKLQRGGEQVIKHVHIDNRGGQAVVAEQIVTGGQENKSGEQAYEQGSCSAALLGENTIRDIVPMPRDTGQEALPHTRRSGGKRSAAG